jgi:hypothetical protein
LHFGAVLEVLGDELLPLHHLLWDHELHEVVEASRLQPDPEGSPWCEGDL